MRQASCSFHFNDRSFPFACVNQLLIPFLKIIKINLDQVHTQKNILPTRPCAQNINRSQRALSAWPPQPSTRFRAGRQTHRPPTHPAFTHARTHRIIHRPANPSSVNRSTSSARRSPVNDARPHQNLSRPTPAPFTSNHVHPRSDPSTSTDLR